MKIAFKNFLQTLRRYKTASLLNVAGLTLAFTAFYIIMVQVWWEMGYNRSIPDAEQIYLVETEDWFEPGLWSSVSNRPIPERVIATTPEIETGGCLLGGFGDAICWTKNAASYGYNKFTVCEGAISLPLLDLFSFRSVEGNLQDISKPNTILISRETAARMNIRIGDMVWVDAEKPQPGDAKEVVAIYEDFPGNSILGKCKIVQDVGDRNLTDRTQWNSYYFIRFRPDADRTTFERRWKEVTDEFRQEDRAKVIAAGKTPDDDDDSDGVRLTPITELYFQSDAEVPGEQGSLATTYTLLGIAVLVIGLALINFVNFFFALVPVRIRTVNTFKVFGAPTSSLRFSFVFEAFGLVGLSLFIAWYVAFILQGSEFASYVSVPLNLSQNLPVVGIVVAVTVLMALAASFYPAWYITSFSPAMVAKGSFAGTHVGRLLCTVLLGVQFFISLSLIVATSFIHLQHSYMMHYDMGFDKHDLLAVRNTKDAALKYEALREKLLTHPQIKAVTSASGQLVSDGGMTWGREFKDRDISFQCYVVEWNFLQVLGIGITGGRDFLEGDMHRENGTLIFNEAARREFDLSTDDRINGFTSGEPIVGFCSDFNFRPLQYGVSPFAFYIVPEPDRAKGYHLPWSVYVRTVPGADVTALADYIRRSISELDPLCEPGEILIRDFNEELGDQYARERRLSVIVGAFSLLSVVIALMGVFGLVLFETQHRRREIAVRRVMGASRGEILAMFNRRYVRLVLVCFVLAVPVSVWAVRHWLAGFAYPVAMHWWVFALALIAVLGVTVLTVSVRSWRAANENPAESVKSE